VNNEQVISSSHFRNFISLFVQQLKIAGQKSSTYLLIMNESFINALQRLVGPKNVLIGPKIADYLPSILAEGQAIEVQAVVFPDSMAALAAISLLCQKQNQTIIMYDGLDKLKLNSAWTGLEVLISLEKISGKDG